MQAYLISSDVFRGKYLFVRAIQNNISGHHVCDLMWTINSNKVYMLSRHNTIFAIIVCNASVFNHWHLKITTIYFHKHWAHTIPLQYFSLMDKPETVATQSTKGPSQYEYVTFSIVWIPIIKTRQFNDRLIFRMWIPILRKVNYNVKENIICQ